MFFVIRNIRDFVIIIKHVKSSPSDGGPNRDQMVCMVLIVLSQTQTDNLILFRFN